MHTDGRARKADRSVLLALTGLLLLAYGLRVFRLDGQSLWWDEMWTAAAASFPLTEVIEQAMADRVHPPLFLMLMHYWTRLGSNAVVLRYFSVICGVVAIPMIYRVGAFIGRRRIGFLAALLLAISPFHIWYSQEARMYSLETTAVLAASWFLLRAMRSSARTDWAGYVFCMVIAMYTHYIALFILLAHYAYLASHYRYMKDVFRKWILASGVVGLFFAIWGISVMAGGGLTRASIGWIPPATWSSPFFTIMTFSAGQSIEPDSLLGYLVTFAVIGATAVAVARFTGRLSDNPFPESALTNRFTAFWLFLPLLLVFLISIDLPVPQKRSIYMDRYLIVLLPALLLLVARGILQLAQRQRTLAWVILGIVFASTGITLANMYFVPAYGRTEWRGAIAVLDSQRQPSDGLWITPDQILPLLYYGERPISYELFSRPFAGENLEPAAEETLESRMKTASEDIERVWIISSYANNDPHGFPQARAISLAEDVSSNALRVWLDGLDESPEEWTFPGIRVAVYDVSESR